MKELFVKIPKEQIAKMPKAVFPGKIVVIQSVEEANRAVEALSKESVVGFDSETRPSFTKGRVNKVSLVQISTQAVCFLFRLNHIGLPESLVRFLSDKDILKIGISLKDDFHQLHHSVDFTPAGFVDLQQTAKAMGIQDMSLQKLYANVFKERISKNARLSNWENDVLTEAQKMYAATDAYTCLRLYYELGRLAQTGDYRLIDTPTTNISLSNKV